MTTPSPDQVQTQALEYMKQGQETLTTMVAAVAENLTTMMRGVAGGSVPGTANLPTPADAIDQAFDLTIAMLEAQRSFAHSVLDAGAPVLRATEQAADPARTR